MNENNGAVISVIIPVYNAEDCLKKSVDSVLNQTYKKLEIILVDDGSKDDSGTICDNYALNDNRIKVIHKKNGGVAEARNTGLEKATGEYISFVDSDDVVHPELLETLLIAITENDCDISVCGYRSCFENEKIDFYKTPKKQTESILQGKETLDLFGEKGAVASNSVWAKLFKATLFENIRFPAFKTAEDLFVAFKLYHKAEKIYVTNTQLYYYVCRQGSLMHSKKLNTDDTVNVCNELSKYCDEFVDDSQWYSVANEKIAFLALNTILDGYYLSIKRGLDKEQRNYHKKLYENTKARYHHNGPQCFKFKLFEKSPVLFYLAMWVFTKFYHKELV